VNHFDQEETVLIPLLENLDNSAELIEIFNSHHRKLTEIMRTLQSTSKDRREQVANFAELLEKHIRFEEREFFPFIENNLSDTQLDEIGEYLHSEHRPGCKTWEPQFWLNKREEEIKLNNKIKKN
jgi:hemerythrin-like domain-containing protein